MSQQQREMHMIKLQIKELYENFLKLEQRVKKLENQNA